MHTMPDDFPKNIAVEVRPFEGLGHPVLITWAIYSTEPHPGFTVYEETAPYEEPDTERLEFHSDITDDVLKFLSRPFGQEHYEAWVRVIKDLEALPEKHRGQFTRGRMYLYDPDNVPEK